MSPSSTGAAASASDAAKTPGQIAHDAAYGLPPSSPVWCAQTQNVRDFWERAAGALSAALATPPSEPASVSGQPAPVVPEEVRRVMQNAITQARGALHLDAMVNDAGKRYGTTVVAMEALAEAEALLAATPSRRADTPLAVPESVRRCLIDIAQQDRGGVQGIYEDGGDENAVIQHLLGRIEARRKLASAALTTLAKQPHDPALGQAINQAAALGMISTPSPDGPEVSAPPGGGGMVEVALAEFQRRNGYHRPEIEELLTEFGELLLAKVSAAPATPEPAAGGERETAPATTTECVELAGAIRREFGKLADAHGDAADDIGLTCDRVVTDVLKFLSVRALPGLIYAPAEAQTAGGEGWQPIETAPRDPDDFMFDIDVSGGCIVAHDDDTGEPLFLVWLQEDQPGSGVSSLTHWRPLPAPPSSTATAHDAPEGGR